MSLGERIKEQRKNCGMSQEKLAELVALCVTAGYLIFRLICRFVWVDPDKCTVFSWFFVPPQGEHSYLYGWLLSSNMFDIAVAISVIPTFFGKRIYPIATSCGFLIGFLAGIGFRHFSLGVLYHIFQHKTKFGIIR